MQDNLDYIKNAANVDALNDLGAILVDARGAEDYEKGHINNAVHLYFAANDEAIKKILPDKEKVYITYCTNPMCSASPMLAKKLLDLGYKHIIEYAQGISGWREYESTREKS